MGQTVSFVLEQGDKGAAAKKIREEEGSSIEQPQEDEGEREFGTVKVSLGSDYSPNQSVLTHSQSYNTEKGFAFIGRSIGGDEYALSLSPIVNTFYGADPGSLACLPTKKTLAVSNLALDSWSPSLWKLVTRVTARRRSARRTVSQKYFYRTRVASLVMSR